MDTKTVPINSAIWSTSSYEGIWRSLVSDGRVRKIAPFNPLYGGDPEQWYLDVEVGEIYARVPLSEHVVPL